MRPHRTNDILSEKRSIAVSAVIIRALLWSTLVAHILPLLHKRTGKTAYRWCTASACFIALCMLTPFWGCGSPGNAVLEKPESGEMSATLTSESKLRSEPVAPTHGADIMIEVQGAVSNPGIYPFRPGARIQDAMEQAGGATILAETRDLNIAARLIDGSVLSVPYRQEADGPLQATAAQLNPPGYTRSGWRGREGTAMSSGRIAAQETGCVNLNTATQAELEALPGVGPKTAAKIMRYREQEPFASPEDLRNVSGIGEKKLDALRRLVCVQ